ncbi:MAG: hypothetical protein FWC96_05970 [Oscillospiraceae bacterium]|nr:hypothetical protein [Oscillospiraceae bacterium]
MKKNFIVVILLILLMAGCMHVNTNPNTLGNTPSQSEMADVPDSPAENTPAWHSVYAPIISTYLAFENGEQPAEIILGSPLTERFYWFFDVDFIHIHHGGVLVFALYDINSNGSPELIIGYKGRDEHGEWRPIRVLNVYTIDGSSLNRIIASEITDEIHEVNTRSIRHSAGNIIEIITEYSLSPDGILIEGYSVSVAIDCMNHETNEILQESGESFNDTPAELNWKRLSEF